MLYEVLPFFPKIIYEFHQVGLVFLDIFLVKDSSMFSSHKALSPDQFLPQLFSSPYWIAAYLDLCILDFP